MAEECKRCALRSKMTLQWRGRVSVVFDTRRHRNDIIALQSCLCPFFSLSFAQWAPLIEPINQAPINCQWPLWGEESEWKRQIAKWAYCFSWALMKTEKVQHCNEINIAQRGKDDTRQLSSQTEQQQLAVSGFLFLTKRTVQCVCLPNVNCFVLLWISLYSSVEFGAFCFLKMSYF